MVLLLTASHALATPSFLDQGYVLTAEADEIYAGGVGAPTVDYDPYAGEFVMFFESPLVSGYPSDCDNAYRIGRATSPNGRTWTVDPASTIEPDLGDSTDPVHCVASQPAVVFDGGTWHLFYSTAKGKPTETATGNESTGITWATSTDGVSFVEQAAPLVPASTNGVGLASATVVDDVLYLFWYDDSDFSLSTLPLDGSGAWTSAVNHVVNHDVLGAWAVQQIIAPSLFCEDDRAERFTLVFGGDDNAYARSLAIAYSVDATSWSFDAGNPFTLGDLDYASLRHWDVLEAGADYLMWYSITDPDTNLKVIGFAITNPVWANPGSRVCPHIVPEIEDTGDTGPVIDTGDTGDTGKIDTSETETDSAETGDTGPDLGDQTAGWKGPRSHDGWYVGGCGCTTTPAAPGAVLGLVALAALAWRRRED